MILDKDSCEHFLKNVNRVSDGLTQMLVIKSLFDLVRDAKLKGTEFVDNILTSYIDSTLTNTLILETIMGYIESAIGTYSPRKYY